MLLDTATLRTLYGRLAGCDRCSGSKTRTSRCLTAPGGFPCSPVAGTRRQPLPNPAARSIGPDVVCLQAYRLVKLVLYSACDRLCTGSVPKLAPRASNGRKIFAGLQEASVQPRICTASTRPVCTAEYDLPDGQLDFHKTGRART